MSGTDDSCATPQTLHSMYSKAKPLRPDRTTWTKRKSGANSSRMRTVRRDTAANPTTTHDIKGKSSHRSACCSPLHSVQEQPLLQLSVACSQAAQQTQDTSNQSAAATQAMQTMLAPANKGVKGALGRTSPGHKTKPRHCNLMLSQW